MKINKKITIAIIIIILVALLISIFKHFYQNVDKESLLMVEEYLNNKYNMHLKIKGYSYYDNGDLGIKAGKHYTFKFKSIEGFKLYAKLDYMKLDKEILNYLILNITDIDKAKELKKYIKENSDVNCKVTECRLVESENYGKYYLFRVELDNNSNDWIMGDIYEEDFGDAKNLGMSDVLQEKINLKNIEDISLIEALKIIKQNYKK